LAYYNKNKNVESIMLEINRGLYLKEPTNEKTEKYAEIKKVTAEFIKTIKSSLTY
jgi:N-formylglutamate amidohydrolase